MSFQTNAISFKKAKGPAEELTEFSRTRLRKFLLPSIEISDDQLTSSGELPAVQVKTCILKKFIFSKFVNPNDKTGAESRRQNAIDKYLSCEQKCSYINSNFDTMLASNSQLRTIVAIARELIFQVLGDFDIEYFTKYAEFGPGASTRLSRPFVDRAFKYEGIPHVTVKAYSLALSWFKPLGVNELVVHNTAEFVTVPKNSLTDRAIEVQPDIVLFQKSLGSVIRRRMRNVVIGRGFRFNLNDQSINQRLAQIGSVDGSLATIDLSSASDTIAWILVARLLPHDWLCALDLLRVGEVNIDGKVIKLSKFSAMGNGYTWELQSLLFWALTKASCLVSGCVEPVVATYGDDIICPTECVSFVMDTLVSVGFTVNKHKSFYTGFFRESCGKFYYRGYDVTPFYVRAPITTAMECIKVHNRLIEWMYRDGFLYEELKPLVKALREHPHERNNISVPYGAGDVGFYDCVTTSNYTVSCKGNRWRMDHYLTEVITSERSLLTWTGPGTLHKTLNSLRLREDVKTVSESGVTGADIPFGNERFHRSHRRFDAWPNLGGWVQLL